MTIQGDVDQAIQPNNKALCYSRISIYNRGNLHAVQLRAVTARVSVQHHARASTTLVLDEHEPDATGASSQAWGGVGEGF